jgi:hypothetical protein
MMEDPDKQATDQERENEAQGAESLDEKLSPEEQMAKFEEAMKNEDWGHQPC